MRRAVQYDLLSRGLSLDLLGTEAFSWYDLRVMVEFLQQDPSTATCSAVHGPRWSVEAQLLAVAADTLSMANWQRAGRKSAPKPKRIPRPWEKAKATVLGSSPIPIAQFADWWDSKARKRKARRAERKKPPATSQ